MTINPYETPAVPNPLREDEPQHKQQRNATGFGREIFGAAVRLSGCWLIVYGAWFGLYAVTIVAAPALRREGEPLEYAMGMLAYCVAGVVLIRFAPGIVRLCYATQDNG
jgi:hypothetical protein